MTTQDKDEQAKAAAALQYETALIDALAQIHQIIAKIPAADAGTVLRFLPSRLKCKTETVIEDWQKDRAARADAEMARLARLQHALEGMQPGDIEVIMKGVSAKAETGKTKGSIN